MMKTAVSIASKKEWAAAKEYFGISENDIKIYPIGEYFIREIAGEDVLFYFCRGRKAASCAAAQHVIDRFGVSKIIVAGTCAGVDEKFSLCDIIVPEKAVEADMTVKEMGSLLSDKYSVDIDLSKYDFDFYTGLLASRDRPLVMWSDHVELKDNGVTVCDTEAAAIAHICAFNGVECVIVKGISDFAKEGSSLQDAEQQYWEYVANTPVIMKKIFDEYLEKFI